MTFSGQTSLGRIRIQSLLVEGCIDNALRRELDHVLSGNSDHEGGLLEDPDAGPEHPNASDVPSSLTSSGKRAADKARRQKRRAKTRENHPSCPYSSMSKKYAKPSGLAVAYSLEALPSARGAFVSQRQSCGKPKEWTLDELVELDYRVIEWDGW